MTAVNILGSNDRAAELAANKEKKRQEMLANKAVKKAAQRIVISQKTGIPAETLLQPTVTMKRTTPTGTTYETYTAPPVVPDSINAASAKMPSFPGMGKFIVAGVVGITGIYFLTRKRTKK